ncbi:MAG: hypothetical protein AB7I79_17680 [Rhizobiaceae bacterium]
MTLEGILGPNDRLDEADGVAVDAPEAVCVAPDGRLLFSSGDAVHALVRWGGKPEPVAKLGRTLSALTVSEGGMVAAGLEGGGFAVFGLDGKPVEGWALPAGVVAVTDCAFLSEDEIVVVDNGYGADESVLAIAPWDDVPRGKALAISRGGGSRVLADRLHCPMGVARDASGGLLLSQLERANVVDGAGQVRQSGYPAYLGRIRRTPGGYLAACLSRRDPLIEFLKTEPDFIAEMKATIEPRHWLSPRAKPEFTHDFPIELGAARLFGEIKPWAPSFSYGLVIELDEQLMPVASAHSRANGARHAISDVTAWNGDLVAVSKASGELLRFGAGAGAS